MASDDDEGNESSGSDSSSSLSVESDEATDTFNGLKSSDIDESSDNGAYRSVRFTAL